MKPIYSLVLLFFMNWSYTIAQNGYEFLSSSKKDIVAFDLYWTGLYDKPNDLFESWRSIGMNISLYDDFDFKKSKIIGAGIGLTYSLASIHHNGALVKDTTVTGNYSNYNFNPLNINYEWNRINIHTISISPELRLRFGDLDPTENNRLFKIYLGSHIGLRFAANNTISIEDQKSKEKIINGLNPFSLTPYVKIGYGDVFIFGNFSPFNLFHTKSSTTIKYFQLGVSFTG